MKGRLVLATIAVVGGMGAGWMLKPSPALAPVTVTKTVTVPGDNIPYPVPVPVPVPHDSVVVDSFWRDVDTAAILRRFFTQYTYQDTIRDTSFLAILREVVTQNQIIERKLSVQNLRPTAVTYTTNTVAAPARWYAGPTANLGSRMGVGAEILYANNKNAFGLSYDLVNRNVGVKWLYSIK